MRLDGCCSSNVENLYFATKQLTSSVFSGRQCLRSSSTSALVVPPTRLRIIGAGAFPITAAKTWNSLPPEVTSSRSTSLSAVKSKLKLTCFPIFSWSGDCKVTEVHLARFHWKLTGLVDSSIACLVVTYCELTIMNVTHRDICIMVMAVYILWINHYECDPQRHMCNGYGCVHIVN